MKTLLICHEEALLDREALARWLASFSDLAGIVVIQEGRGKLWLRSKREIKRIGLLRFLDVVAFRVYYKLFLARADAQCEQDTLNAVRSTTQPLRDDLPVLFTKSPNSPETEAFIKRLQPDIVIARCKILLKDRIYKIPSRGTFVMHPGICPEYRNSHGCFWALANDDAERVGMTLLKIDDGVDTGPIYGYFGCRFDSVRDSHIVIQMRTVFDNLDAIREKLIEIYEGKAETIDVRGRKSAAWGQPWLTRYIRWKLRARRGQ